MASLSWSLLPHALRSSTTEERHRSMTPAERQRPWTEHRSRPWLRRPWQPCWPRGRRGGGASSPCDGAPSAPWWPFHSASWYDAIVSQSQQQSRSRWREGTAAPLACVSERGPRARSRPLSCLTTAPPLTHPLTHSISLLITHTHTHVSTLAIQWTT